MVRNQGKPSSPAAGLVRALGEEMRILARDRRDLPPLVEVKLPPGGPDPDPLPRVAVAAADAGNLELRVHPLRLGLVRVALATHQESALLLQAFLPLSLPLPRLARFLLEQPGGREIARALTSAGLPPDRPEEWLEGLRLPPGRILDFLREFLEWLALLLAAERPAPGEGPVLVLRDGLLRSIALPARIFTPIARALRKATEGERVLLCALAKSLPGGPELAHYLALALPARTSRGGTYPKAFEIPPALEQAFSPASFASSRASRRPGGLYLLLPSRAQELRPLVVEIPSWQKERAPRILSLLCREGSRGFPEPGRPSELLRAHMRAAVSPMERAYFSRLLLREVLRARPGLRDALLAAHLAGEDVLALPREMERNP